MTVHQTSYGDPDGAVFGQSATDKIAFYGATPVAQRASAAQATIAGAAGATYTATEQGLINSLLTLANELRDAHVALGLIKGSA